MRGELIERARLGLADRTAMCELLARNFENVAPAVFEADLAAKQYVIALRDEQEILRGFTTFAIEPVRIAGERVWTLYSGDTIVDRAHWGSPALAAAWIGAVRGLREQLNVDRLVWLLICSGPRTYRFLPVFFRDFYPRFDTPTPSALQTRMHRLAAARYGEQYDPARGIVVLRHPQPLRAELTFERGIPNDGHVGFFHRQNPGHGEGDELVCYTDLSDDNLTRAGARMVRFDRSREASSPIKKVSGS